MKLRWGFVVIALLAFAASADAQQEQLMIWNGRFSAVEGAPDPAEAARFATLTAE